MFDIVMASICRFTVLLLFYALLYINHWSVIAVSFYNYLFIMCINFNLSINMLIYFFLVIYIRFMLIFNSKSILL